jgi:site-specific recombinase XerD
LSPSQVAALLAGCDRGNATGRRDFAILTLLVRLGLRAGEVASLALADVDWRRGELTVRGKGHREDRLPLPADVGQAIVDYLQQARPAMASGGMVFVRAQAPYRALTSHGVTTVVLTAARRAGLGDVTAHRLRHTAATAMLHAGGSLAEIGQVLRHRRVLTTALYAKVDVAALRMLARPWPGDAA